MDFAFIPVRPGAAMSAQRRQNSLQIRSQNKFKAVKTYAWEDRHDEGTGVLHRRWRVLEF